MKSTYTLGPWQWRGSDDGIVNPKLYDKWKSGGYKDEDWPFIVHGVWHNDSTAGVDINDANARLIINAPNLLVALKALVMHDKAVDYRDGLPNHCVELQDAIDAIEEAEGEPLGL